MLLDDEWKAMLADYRRHHDNPLCEATHLVGIPMIMASIPAMAVPPLGASLFVGGWAWQFLGHWLQGNDPHFFGDRRSIVVGAVWWLDTALSPTGLNKKLFGDRTDAPSGA